MGIFDNNIHMNGAGTTYQSFLNLADEAEQKGGKIGERTVRLVKAGDGLATTTFSGSKGDRFDQIVGARRAFLESIAKEFGYAARKIAEKTLGDGTGQSAPLTARTIRAVNDALGDKGVLAEDSSLVRNNKMDFDLETAVSDYEFRRRLGDDSIKLDRARIQEEVLDLVNHGKFPADKEGLRKAIRHAAAPRVLAATILEPMLASHGVPKQLVKRLAATVLDEAIAIFNDFSIPSGKAVYAKLKELGMKCLEKSHEVFDREGIAAGTVFDAENLVKEMFGKDALADEDAQKAIGDLKSKLEDLKAAKIPMERFKTECAKALDATVKVHIVKQIGIEAMLADSKSAAYGRGGARLYDALGIAKEDRRVDDYYFWKMNPSQILVRFDLGDKGPAELRRLAARIVFEDIAADCARKLPASKDAHPGLSDAKPSISNKIANELLDRFEAAVTGEDFATLANDFKARFASQLEITNATLKNIDLAKGEAKSELEARLEELAAGHGVPVTQGMRGTLDRFVSQAVEKLQNGKARSGEPVSVEECKAAIVGHAESKWLENCRQAGAEIDASPLDPAQKKAFFAKIAEGKVDVAHVKMALRTVPGGDAAALAGAAKSGDGKKFAEELYRFVTGTNAKITDEAELKALEGSDDYSAFMSLSVDLLFILNPGIEDGIRGLDAASRGKFFDDATDTSFGAAAKIQGDMSKIKDTARRVAMSDEARHWSAATSCILQRQNEFRA